MSELKRFVVLLVLAILSVGLLLAATHYNDDGFNRQVRHDKAVIEDSSNSSLRKR